MNVLIVGGTRFLGPKIVTRLLDQGDKITLFNRGNDYGNKLPAEVKRLTGDRNKIDDLKQLGADKYDVVYDMTCYDAAQANSLIEAIQPTAHIVFLSTAAVYQKPKMYPLAESAALGEWSSFGRYGTDKAAAENVFIDYCQRHNLKATIFRPVYLLGDNNYFDRENYYFSRIEKGLPILVPGNGQALIQFAFADETAKAFAEIPFKQKPSVEILNIGGPEYISGLDFILLCAEIVGKAAVIRPVGNEEASIKEDEFYDDLYPFPNLNFIVSNERIVNRYGAEFESLRTGLQRIYDTWRSEWDGVARVYPKEKELLELLRAGS